MKARSAPAWCLAAMLVLAGCSSSGSPSVTYQQAATHAHKDAQTSLAALPAGATLRPFGGDEPLPCSDSDGAPPSTPVTVDSTYWVEGVAAAHNKAYISALVNFWRARGWSVHDDSRPHDQFVSMTSHDYSLTFQLTTDGSRMSLATSTPCVKPLKARPQSPGRPTG